MANEQRHQQCARCQDQLVPNGTPDDSVAALIVRYPCEHVFHPRCASCVPPLLTSPGTVFDDDLDRKPAINNAQGRKRLFIFIASGCAVTGLIAALIVAFIILIPLVCVVGLIAAPIVAPIILGVVGLVGGGVVVVAGELGP